ncbi:MAG: response regulator [Desulfamplus sp.]|nr:response regulator [Desulfamplus sp.]
MKKKALVIDDNRNNLMLEKDILEVAGFEVHEAENATDGITAARREKPDIIIMDVRLPDMSGTEAARILRQEKETGDIPIVFVTASVLKDGRENMNSFSNSGFIGKPINTRTFAGEISQFMKGECNMGGKDKPLILIVDDHIKNIELLEAQLVPLGYEIVKATNGEDALEKLSENPIDLILLDVVMPGMDGFEITRRIRADPKHRVLPIVLVTELRESEDRVRGIEAGCDDFLSKPFNKSELLARVQSLLKNARFEVKDRQIQKSESLGRMTGAIAHHFNNQLHAIMGYLELVIEDLPQDTGAVRNLNQAMKAVNKAAEVSGMMLTCLGQTAGREETLDLFEVCTRSMPIILAAMPKHVMFESNVLSLSPVIKADAGQIQHLVMSLITNGWEAIGNAPGDIHLSVTTVSPADITTSHRFPVEWEPEDKNYACLEVQDNGCGIDERDIDKLFDPFFSSKFTGRGLGLSVVLGIVKERGGAVTVKSIQGTGSTFSVFFPLSVEQVTRRPDADVKAPESQNGGTMLVESQSGGTMLPESQSGGTMLVESQSGGTMLVVDDEEMVRTIGATMLRRLGFNVLEAKDGVEALEVFMQNKDEIRLVLCDLSMPRMNGWQTIDALRKLVPDIPVILASGYDEAQVMSGEHCGFIQPFLHKPYHMAELKSVIEKTLEGKTFSYPLPVENTGEDGQ